MVKDSAYGFLGGMYFLQLWGILWVSSLRVGQRLGFENIEDIRLFAAKERLKASLKRKKKVVKKKNEKKVEKKEPTFRDDLKLWEKLKSKEKKGVSWYWYTSISVMSGMAFTI